MAASARDTGRGMVGCNDEDEEGRRETQEQSPPQERGRSVGCRRTSGSRTPCTETPVHGNALVPGHRGGLTDARVPKGGSVRCRLMRACDLPARERCPLTVAWARQEASALAPLTERAAGHQLGPRGSLERHCRPKEGRQKSCSYFGRRSLEMRSSLGSRDDSTRSQTSGISGLVTTLRQRK